MKRSSARPSLAQQIDEIGIFLSEATKLVQMGRFSLRTLHFPCVPCG